MEQVINSTLQGVKKGTKGEAYATGVYTLLAGIGSAGAALASGESVAAMVGFQLELDSSQQFRSSQLVPL